MSSGALLRDRTYVTRLLILRAFHEQPGRTLADVGAGLDVTVQAVSAYVKDLRDAKLLEDADAGLVPTARGLEELRSGLAHLKRAVDDALAPLSVIDVTSALAGARIRAGDEVGLFMERGDLVARPRVASESRGRAVNAAEHGEEVLVRDLAGVVALAPGRVCVVQLPAPVEGGARRVAPKRLLATLKERGFADARVAVAGTGAKALAQRAGLEVAIEFASVEGAFNAAERGLDVALLVTRDLLKDAIALLDARNAATLSRVPIALVDVPADAPEPAPRRGGRAR